MDESVEVHMKLKCIFSLSILAVMSCCSSCFSCPGFSTCTALFIFIPLLSKEIVRSAFHFSGQENAALGFLQAAVERVLWERYEKTFSFDKYSTKNYLTQLQGTGVFDAILSTMKSGLLKWVLNVSGRLFQKSWRRAARKREVEQALEGIHCNDSSSWG